MMKSISSRAQCLQTRAPSAVVRRPSRAAAVAPLCAKKKGFAGEAQAAGLKVNSRGKVSSRPGPAPRKQQQQQQQQEQLPDEQQPATSAATVPAASAEAPVAISSSSSSSGTPTAAPAPSQQQQQQVYSAATPQVVTDRMARRVAACAIAPVLGGIATLGAFWYLKVIAKVEYPMWIAYLGSTLMFGGGLMGITYGILSTSWDPRREGSFWGWTEVRANIGVLMERGEQGQR